MIIKLALGIGIFWGFVTWLFMPEFALMVGLVAFGTSIAALTFNAGAHVNDNRRLNR